MAGTRPVLAWVGGGFLLWFYFVVLGSAFARLNLLLHEPEKDHLKGPPKKPPTTQANTVFTVFIEYIFSHTGRALIGYFEVTGHLTIGPFIQGKIRRVLHKTRLK